MSTRPRARQRSLGSSDGPADSLPIGLDPDYSDCVFKASSGEGYHTSIGVIVSCSPVLRDLVQSCGKQSTSDDVGEVKGSGKKRKTCPTKAVLEVPLPDPEEQIKTLVEHLHQPDRFLASVVPTVTKEGAAKILQLAPIAFKYDMQGILRLIQAALAPASSLSSFISHHENGKMMATWAFACRYRLESVLRNVEARIQAHPSATLGRVEEATTYAASLPSSSADVGLSSLMRMLHVTSTTVRHAAQHPVEYPVYVEIAPEPEPEPIYAAEPYW